MLPRSRRITRGDDYRRVVRRGSRCAGAHTVTHVVFSGEDGVRFGFIVGRNVGGAVERNTVRRRLKAVCAEVAAPPGVGERRGVDVVIRALPGASGASFASLRDEVIGCTERVFRRMTRDSVEPQS